MNQFAEALKTPASLVKFESKNGFAFNADEEAALLETRTSCLPGGLHRAADAYFERACARIADRQYSELCNIMIANKCNKPVAHNYTQLYHELLDPVRNQALQFAEIGIGTPNQDVPSAMAASYPFGSSLRGWQDYLPKTIIRGGDIDPRVMVSEPRIQTSYINQLNPRSINAFNSKFGFDQTGIDFFLDDGLHEFRSNVTLLLLTWPHVKRNGLYLIEDMASTIFQSLLALIPKLSLNAAGIGVELPSAIKSDNRIIVLQKLG